MGVLDLINFSCLADVACYFSDVRASVVCKGERPIAVIDGNCWIYECAYKLTNGLQNNDDQTFHKFFDRYIKRIQYVINCGWIPKVVFDGRHVPLKARTNEKRRNKRQQALEKATKLNREGNIYDVRLRIYSNLAYNALIKMKNV